MTGKDLRIVFMGTPDFAVASLKALIENDYQVVGVITSPDKPAGRGRKLNKSAVKKYAVEKNLAVLQPEKLKKTEFIAELESLKADLQVVVAFRMLPEIVWNMPSLGTFNLHASLLPQYRGAAPLNWAIINGEKETGVTTFLLDHEIDTGKILFKEKIEIGNNDQAGDLHDKLMEIGAGLVLKTVDSLATGDYKAISQDELGKTEDLKHAPKIFKEDRKINWTKPAEDIYNLIRGLSPFPTAWTELENENDPFLTGLKIFSTEIENETSDSPGTIQSDGKTYLKVASSDKWIKIKELQLAGKKRIKTEDFLRGFHNIEKFRLK